MGFGKTNNPDRGSAIGQDWRKSASGSGGASGPHTGPHTGPQSSRGNTVGAAQGMWDTLTGSASSEQNKSGVPDNSPDVPQKIDSDSRSDFSRLFFNPTEKSRRVDVNSVVVLEPADKGVWVESMTEDTAPGNSTGGTLNSSGVWHSAAWFADQNDNHNAHWYYDPDTNDLASEIVLFEVSAASEFFFRLWKLGLNSVVFSGSGFDAAKCNFYLKKDGVKCASPYDNIFPYSMMNVSVLSQNLSIYQEHFCLFFEKAKSIQLCLWPGEGGTIQFAKDDEISLFMQGWYE